jgi:hypothetical protein
MNALAVARVFETRERAPQPTGMSGDVTDMQHDENGNFEAGAVLLLRPFLGVRRKTTEEICQLFSVQPWHDPTNAELEAKRNRVRHLALPALREAVGDGVTASLARTAEMLREDADALDFYAAQLLDAARGFETRVRAPGPTGMSGAATEPQPDGREIAGQARNDNLPSNDSFVAPEIKFVDRASLDVRVLRGAAVAVRRRAIRMAAIQAGVQPEEMTRTQVLAVDALVANTANHSAHKLPGNVSVSRRCGKLYFETRDCD